MKKHYAIIVIAVLAVSVLSYILLIQPAFERASILGSELTKSIQSLEDINQTMRDAPAFFKIHRDIINKKENLASQLYTKEDLIRLFDDLDKKAMKHKVAIVEITPSIEELLLLNKKLPSDAEPQMLNMSISIRGGFIEAGNFIKDMESQKFYQGVQHCMILNNDPFRRQSDVRFSFMAVLGTIRGINESGA